VTVGEGIVTAETATRVAFKRALASIVLATPEGALAGIQQIESGSKGRTVSAAADALQRGLGAKQRHRLWSVARNG